MVSKAMKSAPMPKTKKPAAKAPAAKAPAPKPVGFQPRVCWDDQRRTCIELDRADGQTKYIPLDTLGFELLSTSVVELDRQFSETPDYRLRKQPSFTPSMPSILAELLRPCKRWPN